MTTSTFVRKYIYGLKEGQMFETLDVLMYGARPNVDFALKDLVKKGRVVRLARGIYMRGDDTTPLPSPEDLAAFMANSLGSVFVCLNEERQMRLRSTNGEQKSNDLIFWVIGAGCSFMYGEIRIVLKTISKKQLRKLEQQQSLLRQPIYPTKSLNSLVPLNMVTSEYP